MNTENYSCSSYSTNAQVPYLKNDTGWAQWCVYLYSSTWSLRQEDCEFKDSLSYIVRSYLNHTLRKAQYLHVIYVDFSIYFKSSLDYINTTVLCILWLYSSIRGILTRKSSVEMQTFLIFVIWFGRIHWCSICSYKGPTVTCQRAWGSSSVLGCLLLWRLFVWYYILRGGQEVGCPEIIWVLR
jgi:hypothetical protein